MSKDSSATTKDASGSQNEMSCKNTTTVAADDLSDMSKGANCRNEDGGVNSVILSNVAEDLAVVAKKGDTEGTVALLDKKNSSGRLHQELVSKESERKLGKNARMMSLWFTDKELEWKFRNTSDITTSVSMAGLPIAYISVGISYILLYTPQLETYLVLGIGFLIQMAIFATGCGAFLPEPIPKPLVTISKLVQRKLWLRLLAVVVMVTIWVAFLAMVAMTCYKHPTYCDLPQYFLNLCEAGLLGLTVLTHISHVIKSILVVVVVAVQCSLSVTVLDETFTTLDQKTFLPHGIFFGHSVMATLSLIGILLTLAIINRQFEKTSRRMFLWQEEVERQKEQVSDMRRKNEALVCNILPPHVATHFLGRHRNDEELYSKSYESVGVLFAAMPNFSDFYTEETVNNQGLECLRFLNEVISDYDALLEQFRFRDISKIKTIGATYMAASGLNSDDVPEDSPIKIKWAHLAVLTEFAVALKETLNNINRESFNNFVLRMGINQGPITAGVIGARKPHYDMWGNTVNVASRMESTGKAGHIQVVEGTAHILEEFGFRFEQRGLVSVKGKGKLMTYYLTEKLENGQLRTISPKSQDINQRPSL